MDTNKLHIRVKFSNSIYRFEVHKGTQCTRIGFPTGDQTDAIANAQKYSSILDNCPVLWVDGTELSAIIKTHCHNTRYKE